VDFQQKAIVKRWQFSEKDMDFDRFLTSSHSTRMSLAMGMPSMLSMALIMICVQSAKHSSEKYAQHRHG
jgi:hypothetical protein